MLLPFLLLAVLLLALGPGERVLPARFCRLAALAVCALGAVASLAALALGQARIGPGFDLDGLSSWIVLALLAAAAPSLLTGGAAAAPLAGAMLLAALPAGAALSVPALALVWLLAGRGSWLAVWAAGSAIALVLLTLQAPGGVFGLRLPAGEGEALAALALALAGLAAQWAGLMRGEGSGSAAPLAALGIGVLARAGLVLLGPEMPVWCGLALVAVGLAGAAACGVRACLADDLAAALPSAAVGGAGLAVAGFGVAMAARSADALPIAGLGLDAALLQTLASGTALGTLGLCAAAVRAATGTTALAALGGLGSRMRVVGLAALVAAASLAALPPSAGFAGFYSLLQALFASGRIGGVWLPFAAALAAASAGLAAAATGFAMLRLLGLVFLGAPRSAAADTAGDTGGEMRAGLAVLAGLVAAAGLGAPSLLVLARPTLPLGAETRLLAALAPLAVAALLVAASALAWAALRTAPAPRRVPAWEGGLAPAPLLAPYAPARIGRLVPSPRRVRPRWPLLREWLAAAAAALALALIVLAAR